MGTQEWTISTDRIIDIGEPDECVRRLHVGIVSGAVDVLGHDEATATVEVSQIEGPEVTVRWDGHALQIEQKKQRKWGSRDGQRRCSVRLTVTVPRACAVRLNSVNADHLASGLRSEVRVHAVNGDTVLNDIEGSVSVDNVNGKVTAAHTQGSLAVDTINGDVTCSGGVPESITMHAVNGDLVVDVKDLPRPCTIRASGVNGDLLVRAPQVPVEVTCTSPGGKVTVDGRRIRLGRTGAPKRYHEPDAMLVTNMSGVNGSVTILRRPADAQDRPGDQQPAPGGDPDVPDGQQAGPLPAAGHEESA